MMLTVNTDSDWGIIMCSEAENKKSIYYFLSRWLLCTEWAKSCFFWKKGEIREKFPSRFGGGGGRVSAGVKMKKKKSLQRNVVLMLYISFQRLQVGSNQAESSALNFCQSGLSVCSSGSLKSAAAQNWIPALIWTAGGSLVLFSFCKKQRLISARDEWAGTVNIELQSPARR